MNKQLLILGGTTEAYALAEALALRDDLRVITSLAGRTAQPRIPAGEWRSGGFGGVAGLTTYLREQRIDAVIDATHPFAAAMTWNALESCAAAEVPLLRLERPAWIAAPEDRWELVTDWAEARAALITNGAQRVLLAVGRQELAPFTELPDIWLLIRVVTAPDPLLHFPASQILLARGPFDLAGERELFTAHNIDTIVCKNSGGDATAAKLIVARERNLHVIMRQRPPRPAQELAITVAESIHWLNRQLAT
ncbi:cobalt-precorrin-6A reductase [Chromatium okenii]|uniref:cobalt-precorrin-6A reductase n=1 Tax=Chromatium okenii TaxID=61644 RepID=UPI0026EBC38A|nr:cobalt-precorrin-6A reductase [Chromatium okenii]MBV5310306.1 cobalt-precorrin-6A reductase [Chromatium okenii]